MALAGHAEWFASMAYIIRYTVQVSGQLHDIAEVWRIQAVIRAGCFNSHNDVDVRCLSRRGFEAAVAHRAKGVSGLSQKLVRAMVPGRWEHRRLVRALAGVGTRAAAVVVAFWSGAPGQRGQLRECLVVQQAGRDGHWKKPLG